MSLELNTINTTTNQLERCLDKCEVILKCRLNQSQNHINLDAETGSNHKIISIDFLDKTKQYVVTRIKDGTSKTVRADTDILYAVSELLDTP